MDTNIGVNDPKAVKKWASMLAVDVNHDSYLAPRFIGKSENSVIQRLTDLESDAGDRISFDLIMQLRKPPTPGDANIEGKEENLQFYTDEVAIDQLRAPVSAGGRMTRKRTIHNLRQKARMLMKQYWAKYKDEIMFIYLSGARGMNPDYIEPTSYTGFANNAIHAPDNSHILYGGSATSKGTITTSDFMTAETVERAETYASMLRANNTDATNIQPIMIEGETRYAIVMSRYQEHDMRTKDTNGWMAAQRAKSAADGARNPIFKGGLGLVKNTVLHAHVNSIRFNDYGAGSDLPAARALFMGAQAGVIAHGMGATKGGGTRFMWNEKTANYGNDLNIACGCIFGVKKTRFNNQDFGVIAIDTYAAPVS